MINIKEFEKVVAGEYEYFTKYDSNNEVRRLIGFKNGEKIMDIFRKCLTDSTCVIIDNINDSISVIAEDKTVALKTMGTSVIYYTDCDDNGEITHAISSDGYEIFYNNGVPCRIIDNEGNVVIEN